MPSFKRLPLLLAVLTLALVLALPQTADARATREDTQTFPLAADGRLRLENINGDVVIEAWDRAEVSVQTVIRARSQESLEEVTIAIDARDDSIHIETVYPERENRWGHNNPASVDYTIRMPRGGQIDELELVNGSLVLSGVTGDVNGSLVNGQAEASDLAGDVELSTVNGSLDVSLTELGADQSIKLESVNGSLQLKVPGYADADIEASTVHGGISNDFGLEEKRGRYVGSSLRGTLGNGGARVELDNVNGSISIREN